MEPEIIGFEEPKLENLKQEIKQKSNKSKIVIMMIILLMLLCGGFYFAYNTIFKDKEEDKKETEVVYTNNSLSFQTCYDTNISSHVDFICTETVTYGNKDIKIELRYKYESSEYIQELYINDKNVDKNGIESFSKTITVLNDLIIVVANKKSGSCVFLTDIDGNKIKEIDYLDDTNRGMKIAPRSPYIDFLYKIEDNKIFLVGSRKHDNHSVDKGPVINLENDSQVQVDLCDDSALNMAGVTGDTVMAADYVLEYLGNGKVGDIKIIDDTKEKVSSTLEHQDFKNICSSIKK